MGVPARWQRRRFYYESLRAGEFRSSLAICFLVGGWRLGRDPCRELGRRFHGRSCPWAGRSIVVSLGPSQVVNADQPDGVGLVMGGYI
eukprot:scaffold125882_cov47-Prasinocladus_malaysianus.AAC.4